MANNTSQHILSTAANLLGFCLFVITSIHFSDKAAVSIIDEFTSIIAVVLICSCFLSFMSIKTQDLNREVRLEKLADTCFIASLIGILIIILLITINFIN